MRLILKKVVKNTKKLSKDNKQHNQIRQIYERYLTLLDNYVDTNNVLGEYNNVEVVKIKESDSSSTLWVIYSYINAEFFYCYGKT